MDDSRITRINELYHKSQAEGLTEEEKAEQIQLRAEYIAAVRANMRGTLNNVSILNPDGTVTELATKAKKLN
jgi:uncharacterized protein YnzC (UPF0291/DUF896 family)